MYVILVRQLSGWVLIIHSINLLALFAIYLHKKVRLIRGVHQQDMKAVHNCRQIQFTGFRGSELLETLAPKERHIGVCCLQYRCSLRREFRR